ncbi:ACT domain-containing protein [Desulfuribacillus alkaliarsenatis]|uniref:UPF0735 ACT domain-containing protein BHF68_12395 n=1 Tax=Desulfuribacillus alkaliarsenatis TaxID=766136 RepID=A0A1E5FYW9_9FIRM|nr:ACT domain-containing protein [Desulfuribacillus alkaliarsenatis]OEF95637.1 ACT domain-containing protein [Desulfuribacillus alkaliarsenatis]
MAKQNTYYLVEADILPEVIVKTARAKELLSKGEVATVTEAVEAVGISRSVFYKYKDGILPFYEASRERIVTITMELIHEFGVLSNVLQTVAKHQGNVLTINQTLPLQGLAIVTLTMETKSMDIDIPSFLEQLINLKGVKKAQVVGHNEQNIN